MAKRWLCATDPGYHDGLSWNSKNTLKYQESNGPYFVTKHMR